MKENKKRNLKNLLLAISITSAILSVISASVSLYLNSDRGNE